MSFWNSGPRTTTWYLLHGWQHAERGGESSSPGLTNNPTYPDPVLNIVMNCIIKNHKKQ